MFKLEDPDPEDENDQYPVQRINKRKEKFAIGFRIYEVNSKINRAELGQAQVKLEVKATKVLGFPRKLKLFPNSLFVNP